MVVVERTAKGRRVIDLPEAPVTSPAASRLSPEEAAEIRSATPLTPAPQAKPDSPSPANAAAVAKRRHEMEMIMPYAKEFLAATENKNVIPITEFQRYMPLFKKSELDRMSDDEKAELTYQYATRINPQQPVHVIDLETPENRGAPYRGTRYKIMFTLPAWTNRIESVNHQGEEALKLAAEYLANARSTNNPFDSRLHTYSAKLAELIAKGNEKAMAEQEAERSKIREDLMTKVGGGTEKASQTPSSTSSTPQTKQENAEPTEPAGLDAEWDE